MVKKTISSCSDLPLSDITQKIYNLSSRFCIALIQMKIDEPRQLQLHIKLVEKESARFICLNKVFMMELFRQLNQFESANIEYPCAAAVARDIGVLVKTTSNPGDYELIFGKIKLILDSDTVKYLLSNERTILNNIRDIEYHHIRGGYDVVDC